MLSCLVVICMQFSTKVGRQKMLKLFINTVRWVRTVDHMRLLPPGPPCAIDFTFLCDSPYPGKAISQLWHENDLYTSATCRYVLVEVAAPCLFGGAKEY